eukprot:13464176-Alexandrium_andersonii.AAC.1
MPRGARAATPALRGLSKSGDGGPGGRQLPGPRRPRHRARASQEGSPNQIHGRRPKPPPPPGRPTLGAAWRGATTGEHGRAGPALEENAGVGGNTHRGRAPPARSPQDHLAPLGRVK